MKEKHKIPHAKWQNINWKDFNNFAVNYYNEHKNKYETPTNESQLIASCNKCNTHAHDKASKILPEGHGLDPMH